MTDQLIFRSNLSGVQREDVEIDSDLESRLLKLRLKQMMEDIGIKLRGEAHDRGLDPADLARMTNLEEQWIQDLFDAQLDDIDINSMIQVSCALEVRVDFKFIGAR